MTRFVGLWLTLLIFLSGPVLEGKVRFGDFTIAAENAAVKLTQSEASAVSKINNILNKGIKPGPKGDISGAVADMVGAPIPKPGGGVWDHAQDLGGMLRGLRNNAAKLSNSTDPAAVAARQQAQQMIQTIEAAIKGNGL